MEMKLDKLPKQNFLFHHLQQQQQQLQMKNHIHQ
jgi:hypothetical protein